MEHLIERLQDLEKRLQRGAILFLDYDGTLIPIARRPELAALAPDMKGLLRSLAGRFKVAIISGRSLFDLEKLVGVRGIYYVGNHGLEISGPGVKFVQREAGRTSPAIAEICRKLERGLEKIDGAIIENKGLTASLHYREVKRKQIADMREIFEEIVKPYAISEVIRVTHGKKVFEIKPNIKWDKGNAVLWIIEAVDPKKELVPVYIGDDRTDEDAFLALKNRGITILVSEKPKESHAKFFLRDVKEVKMFLKKLVKL
jgi:alpha,alpha-trehalase